MQSEIHQKDSIYITIFVCLLPILIFTSKVSADITLSLTGLYFLFYSALRKNFAWLTEPWVIAASAFFLLAVGTSFFSPYPKDALIQSLIFVRWPLAAIAIITLVLTTHERLRLFEKSALFFLLFIVADTILQMVLGKDILGHLSEGDGSRLTGPFKKLLVGVYSLKLFFYGFASIYAAIEKNKKNIIYLTLLILAFDVFLLLTGERVIFLLGLFFFIIWFMAVFFTYESLRKAILALMVSGFSVIAIVVFVNHALFIKRFMPFVDAMKNFSGTVYADIFRSAFEVWQLSPWFGVGTRMYHNVCISQLGYPTDEAYSPVVNGICQHHPHNIYLEVLAQNGLFGLLIFVAMLFLIFKQILTKELLRRDALMVAVLFSSIFIVFWPLASSMSIFANNYAGVVWLTIAWVLARAHHLPKVEHTK